MSWAPSHQMVSLFTAHLFYIASLCSLESRPLWVGLSSYWQRLKVTDKESKGQNGLVWVSLTLSGKSIFLACRPQKLNCCLGNVQFKSNSCLCSQQEQKRNNTLLNWCDLIELGCQRFHSRDDFCGNVICLLWDSIYQIKKQRYSIITGVFYWISEWKVN